MDRTTTVALSIAEIAAGDQALQAIYESKGEVVAVTDSEIIAAASLSARMGLAIEEASTATFAVALKSESVSVEEEWVLIGSGSAAKWPAGPMRNYVAPAILGDR